MTLEELRLRDPEFRESDGEFRREHLFAAVQAGDTVTIERPKLPSFRPEREPRQFVSGRATIWNRQQRCWVLNLGGPHGTPGIADARNTVSVVKAGCRKPLQILKPR